MRKWLIYLEFFLISAYFVIIPLIKPVPEIQTISFNLNYMSLIMTCLFLYIYYRYEFTLTERRKLNILTFLINIGKVLFYFGIIVLINSILTVISVLFEIETNPIKLPEITFFSAVFGIVKFLISAFFEEGLYRLYLPSVLIIFSGNFVEKFFCKWSEKKKKYLISILRWLIEILCVYVFALGHRYLGFLAVINAFLSGIILRLIYLKNKSIFFGAFAHFIYNIFIVVILILLKN